MINHRKEFAQWLEDNVVILRDDSTVPIMETKINTGWYEQKRASEAQIMLFQIDVDDNAVSEINYPYGGEEGKEYWEIHVVAKTEDLTNWITSSIIRAIRNYSGTMAEDDESMIYDIVKYGGIRRYSPADSKSLITRSGETDELWKNWHNIIAVTLFYKIN